MDGSSPTVAKFGGSSLATDEQIERVADRITATRRSGRPVVVVVSARGDTTDRLVAEAGSASAGALPDPADDPDAGRETDQLLATGEVASAALLALALRTRGVEAESLTGAQAGVRATGAHGGGIVTAVDTERIEAALAEGRVPVVAGFQAHTETGDVITLGRGGSDTSAVALAAALGAGTCEIYTDVDGVFDADPRVVAEAETLAELSVPLMAEMAFAGARVLHVRAVELAAACGIELVVRHAHGDEPGSVVSPRHPWSLEESTGVVAVTHEEALAQVTVHGVGDPEPLLAALADHEVTVDALVWSPAPDAVAMIICVAAPRLPGVRSALDEVAGVTADRIAVRHDLGKVSLVGAGLLTRPHIAARTLAELRTAGIDAQCVSGSQSRLCFVVPDDRLAEAVRIAHRQVLRRSTADGRRPGTDGSADSALVPA